MSALVETMAYNKVEVPWHKLGNPVDGDLTVPQMLKAAELDWTVSLRDMYINGKSKDYTVIKGTRALTRDSDDKVLSIVGSSYRPFQNEEAMDFFTKFVDAGHMTMETAGSLSGGKYIWGLAKINKNFKVGKKDDMLSYMLMMQPHKLGHAMIFQTTAIRVVCWNTLNMALGSSLKGRAGAYSVPHLAAFDDKAKGKAEEALGLATTQLDEFAEAANFLATKKIGDVELRGFFKTLLKEKADDEAAPANDDTEQKDSIRLRRYLSAFEAAPGQDIATAKGTWWGAVNAVTYVVDHVNARTQDLRLSKAWFGSGAIMKRKALQLAVKLAA